MVKSIKEARQVYGENYQEHVAESDHIDPLNRIVNRNINNPWLMTEDIKEAANRPDNIQIISRRNNQTGGKGGMTQEEWCQDIKKMEHISTQSGRSVDEICTQVKQTGEKARNKTDQILRSDEIFNLKETAKFAGKTVAINTAGTAATISGVYNIAACLSGEKEISKALLDVAGDSFCAGVKGGVSGAGLTVINNTLAAAQNEFIASLGKNNAVGKSITVISIAGETVNRWCEGEISTAECLMDLGEKGGSYAGAMYGAGIGQAVIPIPIVGGAIGSMVGARVSSAIIEGIKEAVEEKRREHERIVQEMMRYYAEKQRREEVKTLIHVNTVESAQRAIMTIATSDALKKLVRELKLSVEDEIQTRQIVAEHLFAAFQLQEYRRQLQDYIDKYFSGYEKCFSEAFNIMDTALEMGDYESAMIGTNKISRLFGKKPVVENTQDFTELMFGDEKIEF